MISRPACFIFLVLANCSGAPPAAGSLAVVAAAPPPRDDGQPSKGGAGGAAHAAALEELKIAPMGITVDKQNSVRIPIPDPSHWARVKFWGVPTLVGYRYGKEHHALVAAFVVHTDDPRAPRACIQAFEGWAKPWVDAFDVEIEHDPPQAIAWNGSIVDIESMWAKTATLVVRQGYAGAYATYPVWKGACLVVGVAVPSGDDARAKEVRDRFVREVFPRVEVTAASEPPDLY